MLPSTLSLASFTTYPPQARALAEAHLALFRQMPLAFLPSLLRELIEYDFKFPIERGALDRQLAYLAALPSAERDRLFTAFAGIHLTPELIALDWCNRPIDFTEQLSASLWQTHQMPAFRQAATDFGAHLQSALPAAPPPLPRLGIALIGKGAQPRPALFRMLREHGTVFTSVDPAGGVAALLAALEDRAARHRAPYAHWYIDGGAALAHSGLVTGVSYAGLAPVRAALLDAITRQVSRPGMGPEELRDHLMHLTPAELGLKGDAVLDHFQLKVLTEGSGTQIFSTTFAQWAAREALRRAEAVTLVVRFAPRQRQRPMNELLANQSTALELDPQGSLIDADMAAYYQWINQQRLPGAAQSAFLAWFEDQREAVAIGPALPRGIGSRTPVTLARLLALALG